MNFSFTTTDENVRFYERQEARRKRQEGRTFACCILASCFLLLASIFKIAPLEAAGLPDLTFDNQKVRAAEAFAVPADRGFGGLTTNPVAGDFVTIGVTVANSGDVPAEGIEVGFYEGDPRKGGTPIGSVAVVSHLSPGEMTRVTRGWDTIGRAGKNLITIILDPRGKVEEKNKGNNIFTFETNVALLGDFNQDGQIDPLDLSILKFSLGSRPGDANWNPLTDIWATGPPVIPPPDIRASRDGVIDKADLALFSSLMDLNLTLRSVTLSHDHTDHVVFLRGGPPILSKGDGFLVGEVLRLTVRFPTVGSADVGHLNVAFVDGNPAGGGREIGRAVVSKVFGGIGTATLLWPTVDAMSGEHRIFAVADPENRKEESSEMNNTISTTILLDRPTVTPGDSGSSGLPVAPVLLQNTPNPFNAATSITIVRPYSTDLRIDLFDISGQRVRTLFAAYAPAGRMTLLWNGRDDDGHPLPSGIYIYRMITGGHGVQTKKMVLVR